MRLNSAGRWSFSSLSLLVSCASLQPVSQVPNAEVALRPLGTYALTRAWKDDTQQSQHGRSRPKTEEANEAWQWRDRFSLGAPSQSYVSPQFVGADAVLVGTLGGGIQLLRARSGGRIWSKEIPIGVGALPLVNEPYVYMAGMDAYVRKLRLSTGEEVWKTKISVESTGGLALNQGILYVTSADNILWALDEKTGHTLWQYRRPSSTSSVYWSLRGSSVPVLSPDGRSIYVGFSDGTVVGLESAAGNPLWEKSFADRPGRFKDADLTPAINEEGSEIYVALVDGDLVALKSSNGATLWTSPVGAVSSPLYDAKQKALYVSALDGSVKKFSTQNSRLLWSQSIGHGLASTPVLLGDRYLSVALSQGGLMLLRQEDGATVNSYDAAISGLAQPAFDGRRLATLSARNELLIFSLDFKKKL